MTSQTVSDNHVIQIHYSLHLGDSEVIDSSREREPLVYLHGASNIVPGLERQITDKAVGEKFSAVVPAAEGYGETDGATPQPVDRNNFPEGVELDAGMAFQAEGPDGEDLTLWIHEVQDDQVFVATHHPLAGKDLHFDIEVIGIRAATEDEVAHGHPHGPDGDQVH